MSDTPMETDVVVVGSGVSGLAAALEAVRGGARAAVFEKQPSLGGTSNFFEGVFAVGSAMQKEKYIAYSSDQAFKNFVEYNHWRVDARLVRSIDITHSVRKDTMRNLRRIASISFRSADLDSMRPKHEPASWERWEESKSTTGPKR